MFIGLVGRGFVGEAILQGMHHALNIVWYDIATRPFVDISNAVRVESLESLCEQTDGPIFVCLPTPMRPDGACSLTLLHSVLSNLNDVAQNANVNKVVIIKSTVPPGTTTKCNAMFENLSCVFNPEFLREATAIEDFKNQDRVIIGGPHEATSVVKQMYQIAYPQVPTTKTSSDIAEMVKYLTNCFLALKVSFANEIAEMCDKIDIDYDKVVEYAAKDKRLGMSHWSVPGPDGKKGFSGTCFPKDLNALIYFAEQLGCKPNTLKAAWETNLRVRPEKDWEQLKGKAVENS